MIQQMIVAEILAIQAMMLPTLTPTLTSFPAISMALVQLL